MIQLIGSLRQRLCEARLRDAFPQIEDPYLRQVARAVASLPPMHHEVFRLARVEGLTIDQIAQRLDLSRRQARRHFVGALMMLCRSVERQARKGW